jgi:hypothetical protein
MRDAAIHQLPEVLAKFVLTASNWVCISHGAQIILLALS